jgi:hypothetical protein
MASDSDTPDGDGRIIAATLRDLLQDPLVPAAAKAAAARTLAEMRGLLGRHQDKPDNLDNRPLSALSQADLRRELLRLQGLER